MPQVKIGKVVSTKIPKTVIVAVETKSAHKLYKKMIKRTSRFKAKDDIGAKVGQMVKITETRPLSADIHFKITEVVK